MADKQVDIDGLSASLDELVKAADATALVKAYGGVNITSGGHTDERGATSGGYPGSGDMGALDDMMIGKMASTLAAAGFSASQIAAFMNDDDEEEDEDEDEMEGKIVGPSDSRVEPPPPMEGKAQPGYWGKSMDAFRADKDIADAVDISPYLEALTQKTAESLDSIRKSMGEGRGEQARVNKALGAAIYQIGALTKSIAQASSQLNRRLGIVEAQPASPRGATTHRQALAKSMPGEAGNGHAPLSKGELLSSLSYMNLEKGLKTINGQKTSEVIGLFEGGNVISSETVDAVNRFIATHPTEEKLARTYR